MKIDKINSLTVQIYLKSIKLINAIKPRIQLFIFIFLQICHQLKLVFNYIFKNTHISIHHALKHKSINNWQKIRDFLKYLV